MWIMEVKVKGTWRPVSPSTGAPYEYKTKEEAENMLKTCYPDQVREGKLFGDPITRVREVKE